MDDELPEWQRNLFEIFGPGWNPGGTDRRLGPTGLPLPRRDERTEWDGRRRLVVIRLAEGAHYRDLHGRERCRYCGHVCNPNRPCICTEKQLGCPCCVGVRFSAKLEELDDGTEG